MALSSSPVPTVAMQYAHLDRKQMEERVKKIKAQLGERLVILGHHYQKDEVFQFADFTGDSLKLAQQAARQSEAQYIVFCGVHFMAETADILTSPHQQVILPDLKAGCSMADMADDEQVETCWAKLQSLFGDTVLPITYVNSTAAIKAFCGQHGGLTCTSSNAKKCFNGRLNRRSAFSLYPTSTWDVTQGCNWGFPWKRWRSTIPSRKSWKRCTPI